MTGTTAPPPEKYDAFLANIENLKTSLTALTNIKDIKDLKDQAEAVHAYLKRANASLEIQNLCAELKILAERRVGQLLTEIIPHEGGRPSDKQSHDETVFRLRDFNISKTQSSRWQLLSRIPEELFNNKLLEDKESRTKEITTASFLRFARKLETKEDVSVSSEWAGTPDVTSVVSEWKGNLGEWWSIGRHLFYHGDIDSNDVKEKLAQYRSEGRRVAIAFADLSRGLHRGEAGDRVWNHDFLIEYADVVAVSVNPENMVEFLRSTQMGQVYLTCVPFMSYNRDHMVPKNFESWFPILLFSNTSAGTTNNTAHVPIFIKTTVNRKKEIIRELLSRFSNKDEIILDVFPSTLSVLAVAELLGRQWIGAESDFNKVSDMFYRVQKELPKDMEIKKIG